MVSNWSSEIKWNPSACIVERGVLLKNAFGLRVGNGFPKELSGIFSIVSLVRKIAIISNAWTQLWRALARKRYFYCWKIALKNWVASHQNSKLCSTVEVDESGLRIQYYNKRYGFQYLTGPDFHEIMLADGSITISIRTILCPRLFEWFCSYELQIEHNKLSKF